MKKFAICLILAISCSLAASAQIQREFFGFKLGVSTETEVLNKLLAQNSTITKLLDDPSIYVVENSQLLFAGKKWPYIQLSFSDDKLFGIAFIATDEDYTLDEIKQRAKELIGLLKTKYAEYFVEENSEVTEKRTKDYYFDLKTILEVESYINSDGTVGFNISFGDWNM